jgi:hypothetical protein
MVPYSKAVLIVAQGGEDNAIELPAPIRGVLERLTITEIGGSDNFTARLFCAERAAGNADSLSDVDEDVGMPPEAFAITPALTGTAGKYEQFSGGWGYVSNELASPGRLKSALWLRLTPAGSGEKSFAVAYTVMAPELM